MLCEIISIWSNTNIFLWCWRGEVFSLKVQNQIGIPARCNSWYVLTRTTKMMTMSPVRMALIQKFPSHVTLVSYLSQTSLCQVNILTWVKNVLETSRSWYCATISSAAHKNCQSSSTGELRGRHNCKIYLSVCGFAKRMKW